MKKKVIAIFDIGKTNKKILLFDESLKVVSCIEEEFKTSVDEDSVECDDIDLIEVWMKSTLEEIIKGGRVRSESCKLFNLWRLPGIFR